MNNKSHVSFFVSLLKEAFHNGLKMGGNGVRQKKPHTVGLKSEGLTYFFVSFCQRLQCFPPKNSNSTTLIYGLFLNHINVTSHS